jgi:outer membrane protein assembly factor BamE
MGVEAQGMVGDLKTMAVGHFDLQRFDFFVMELFNTPAIQAHQVVVVFPFIELIHRTFALKMATRQDSSAFKLHQYTVDGGQTDVDVLQNQLPVYVLSRHVALPAGLKDIQNFETGQRGLQANIFEVVGVGHAGSPSWAKQGARYNECIIALQPYSAFLTMFEFCRKALLPSFHRRTSFIAVCLFAAIGSTACSSLITPYRSDVVQGNFVSREQTQALRLGMPRQAVRDILGTPLVTSLFHADRWDYAFTFRRQGAEPQLRRFSVLFKNDILVQLDGDPLPSEAEFAAQIDTRTAVKKVPELKATEADLAQFPAKTASPVAPLLVPARAATYPPLEAPVR